MKKVPSKIMLPHARNCCFIPKPWCGSTTRNQFRTPCQCVNFRCSISWQLTALRFLEISEIVGSNCLSHDDMYWMWIDRRLDSTGGLGPPLVVIQTMVECHFSTKWSYFVKRLVFLCNKVPSTLMFSTIPMRPTYLSTKSGGLSTLKHIASYKTNPLVECLSTSIL